MVHPPAGEEDQERAVSAALRSVIAQQRKETVLKLWEQVSTTLATKFTRPADLMTNASEDVLAIG